MKKLLLLLLIVPFLGFSQNSRLKLKSDVELDVGLNQSDYNKILDKLNLNVTNRGFDGSWKVLVWGKYEFKMDKNGIYGVDEYGNDNNPAKTLWEEALFEMGVEMGNMYVEAANVPTGDGYSVRVDREVIDTKWVLVISNKYEDFSGKVYNYFDPKKVIATFNTKANVKVKKRDKFKSYVKVIYNELVNSNKN